jgi:hypothetical protein
MLLRHEVAERGKAPLPGGDGRSEGAVAGATGINVAALDGRERAEDLLGRQSVDVLLFRH